MMQSVKNWARDLLVRSQGITGTDNVYIAKGGFWTSLPFGVSTVLSALLLLAFANFVSKDDYGAYKYALSVAGSISFLTLTGMNAAITQMTARGVKGLLVWSVRQQLRFNLLYFAISGLLATYYAWQGNTTLAISIAILGVSLPISAALNTYGAYLAGEKQFKRAALLGIGSGTAYSAIMLIAIFVAHTPVGLVFAYALASTLPALYYYWRVVRELPPHTPTAAERQEVANYSGHLSFINVFSTIAQYLDKIILFQVFGAVELAVYSFAQAIPERAKGFSKTFAGILLPKLAERTIADISTAFYIRVAQGAATGLAVFGAYWFAAPYIFSWLLPQYLESLAYSRTLMFVYVFMVPATYTSMVFRSQQMLRAIYISSIFGHAGLIILYLTMGPAYGLWGMVWAQICIGFLGTILNIVLWEVESRRLMRLRR